MHKDFKLSKETKRILALGKFKSDHERGAWKRAMIEAQLVSEKFKRDSQRGKPKDE